MVMVRVSPRTVECLFVSNDNNNNPPAKRILRVSQVKDERISKGKRWEIDVKFELSGVTPPTAARLLCDAETRRGWDATILAAVNAKDDDGLVRVVLQNPVGMSEYHYRQVNTTGADQSIVVTQTGIQKSRKKPKQLRKRARRVLGFHGCTTLTPSTGRATHVHMVVSEPRRLWVPIAVLKTMIIPSIDRMVQTARAAAQGMQPIPRPPIDPAPVPPDDARAQSIELSTISLLGDDDDTDSERSDVGQWCVCCGVVLQ